MRSLSKSVHDYLALRRSAGFVMRYETLLLPQLVGFLRQRRARSITSALALEFAMMPAGVQRFHWANRLRIVRGFARFRCADDPRTEVPPPGLLPSRYVRKTPTIVSDDDLARILRSAAALPSTIGLRPRTYSTIIALLAATGMRPGEAVRLRDHDVDVSAAVVTVRESKGRTRLVPLHTSAARALQRYRADRRRLVPRPIDDTFFVGDAGRAICRVFLDTTFRKLRKTLALDDARVRLHDLRHRFAVRTVEDWYRDKKPIEPRMETLSTYLGHASPRHTYWYLTATAELAEMAVANLDAPLIARFLEHLEHGRGNTARTRNTRLAALHSLYRFAALQVPSESATIQRVLAIPHKRFDRRQVDFLSRAEVDALISAPDVEQPGGRRDKAMLMVAVQTGLRVSELTSLRVDDLSLGRTSHVRCRGKGRKERATPLSRALASVLRRWLRERAPLPADAPLFPNARGGPLTRDGVAHLLRKHALAAAVRCPSLATKRVTPHVLRHTAAMRLLEGGVDRAVIALWLGHESIETTQAYFHADLGIKTRALAHGSVVDGRFARYRPTDKLLAFLTSL